MKLDKKQLAATAIFTAFVAAATMVISAYVPSTRGYFNVGEIMVYTTALLMGPFVGGFAGGVGSMIADIVLGYTYFAPGTLVIKGLEGMIVGYLGRLAMQSFTKLRWRMISIMVALGVGILVWQIGTGYYSGDMEFTFSIPQGSSFTWNFFVPELFWISVAGLSAILIVVASFSVTPRVGWLAFSIIVGGLEMILGYFLYEYYALGMGVAAFAELPVNFGQLTVGLLVAIPLVRAVRSIMPASRLGQEASKVSSKSL